MTFHDKVTAEDIWRAVYLLCDLESRSEVTADRVSNLSRADFGPFSADQLRKLANARKDAPLRNRVKSAIIAPKPDQFGLARKFQMHNANPSMEIRIFKDSASAYEWIGRPGKTA